MSAFINGLLTGGSLIVAIGSQNAYVLKQGLLKSHVFLVCSICAIADALLIAIGTSGLGRVVSSYPQLLYYISLFGALFLFVYGVLSFRDAIKPVENQYSSMEGKSSQEGGSSSVKLVVITVLALTFLNPHVYLDTVLLIGSIASPYSNEAKYYFTFGAISASFIWFFSLGYGARLLIPLFAKTLTWQILNISIAIIMWSIAWMLLRTALGLS